MTSRLLSLEGLPPDDRAVIETLFLEGGIQILCTTTTLAHGVNLPAHLVVVKGVVLAVVYIKT